MSDWQDTVKHFPECELRHIQVFQPKCTCGAEVQAQLSFEAGQQEGRREVCGWVDNNTFVVAKNHWQEQKAKWGLK
jgi:hypothetical protein